MTIWLVRAGKHGEREDFALANNVAVIGWNELPDMSGIKTRKELLELLQKTYPNEKDKTLMNWEAQLWAFIQRIKPGDLVALPLKRRSAIALGRVEGAYTYKGDNPSSAQHNLSVKWESELPRAQFGQDLLYSLGSAQTVCRIERNNAEERIKNLLVGKKDTPLKPPDIASEESGEETDFDVEQYARDQIVKYINSKFKGHDLQQLVGAILQAQGYTIRIAPEGPDGGVDIIAGRGALGFEPPRLAVQVKSSDSPVDVGVLRELQGVMSAFGADLGLVVAWGGYRGSVEKEAARQFFKIRLWDSSDLVSMLQTYYEQLPDDIQAELPLKRIWALVPEEE
jgi:restriction system protein